MRYSVGMADNVGDGVGDPNKAPGAGGAVKERDSVQGKTKEPALYSVILLNDDYTTMEFVIAMLMKHFHKPPAEALHVMLLVHRKGAGIAGVYTRDVAETKVAEVTQDARDRGHPLLLTTEPEE